jgi:hypothetical protein
MLLDCDEIPFATADVALCCAFDRMLLQAPVGSDALLDVQSVISLACELLQLPRQVFGVIVPDNEQPRRIFALLQIAVAVLAMREVAVRLRLGEALWRRFLQLRRPYELAAGAKGEDQWRQASLRHAFWIRSGVARAFFFKEAY